jgi:S-adenosylmethionine hydrolase
VERPERPVIGFLTDFGLDGAAATCRGVMLGICREAQIVDISHTVRKFAIRDGAYLLRSSLPYLPVGIHVGVVDPGVGTERRPIALRVGRGDVLVGPDNGLLISAADALGGIEAARVLENRAYWLPVTSSTFHGRDLFAPVAAHLAAGTAQFDDLGGVLPIRYLVRLDAPRARVSDGALETVVTYVDSFGNLRLAGGRNELVAAIGEVEANAPVTVEFGPTDGTAARREIARFVTAFGDVGAGSALLYVDSSGRLAFADNQGNAALRLGVETDRATRITRAQY